MTEIAQVPFNGSYWVVPTILLAGGYPGSEDPIEEERNLKGLIQAGIRHVKRIHTVVDSIVSILFSLSSFARFPGRIFRID